MEPKLSVLGMPRNILAKELTEAGLSIACALVIKEIPTASEDWFDPMRHLQQGEYSWVVLSNVATAKLLGGHYELDELLVQVQVMAVGSATVDAIRAYGGCVDFVGPGPVSVETLAEAFPSGGGNVPLPCVVEAAPTLAEGLSRKGYDVERLWLYESVALDELPLTQGEALALDEPTVALITIGPVVRAAHRQLSKAGIRSWPVLVAFGKSSAEVSQELGRPAGAVCPTTNAEGVLTAYREIVAGLDRAD